MIFTISWTIILCLNAWKISWILTHTLSSSNKNWMESYNGENSTGSDWINYGIVEDLALDEMLSRSNYSQSSYGGNSETSYGGNGNFVLPKLVLANYSSIIQFKSII
ncbi:unnamed protein product [Gordionus sp. m RMFG-2023]